VSTLQLHDQVACIPFLSSSYEFINSNSVFEQMRILECFENLDEKIAQIQELIDNEEAESKENKKGDSEDEDYVEENEEGEESEETDEDYEEEDEQNKCDITTTSSVIGIKRSLLGSSVDAALAISNPTNKRSKTSEKDSTEQQISNPVQNYEYYNNLTMKELKDICRAKQLNVGGRKADLVKRCTSGVNETARPGKSLWNDLSCQIA
jgi:hypothetical protein